MKNTTKISLMSGLMFAGMALGGIHIANAQNNVNSEIDNSRYTVMIPSEVTIDKESGKGSFAVTGKVDAQTELDVSVSSQNGYKLKNKNQEISYSLDKDSFYINNIKSADMKSFDENFNITLANTNTNYSGNYEDRLTFNIGSNKYTYELDMNSILDGVRKNEHHNYGAADVYINGVLKAENVSDFREILNYGDTYEFKNIKATDGHHFVGINSCANTSIKGRIGADTNYLETRRDNPYNLVAPIYFEFNTNKLTINYHADGAQTWHHFDNITYDVSGKDIAASETRLFGSYYDGKSGLGDVSRLTKKGYTAKPNTWIVGKNGTKEVIDSTGLTKSQDVAEYCGVLNEFKKNETTIDLYPIWTANTYTLTVNPNGGLINGDGSSKVLDTKLCFDTGNCCDINYLKPTRKGFEFLGWYDAPENGNIVYDSNGKCINNGNYWKDSSYVNPNNLTVYAYWKKVPYSIGTVLNIEGSDYIVMSQTDDDKYLVMRKDSIGNKKFQSIHRADGQNQNTYEGSEIDNYLENDWYNSLSSTMKSAIQPTSIKQASYATFGDPDSIQKTGFNGQVYNTIDRHAFLPSVSEIGKAVDLKNPDKLEAFLNGDRFWTRDSFQRFDNSVESLGAHIGGLIYYYVYNTYGVRPAFVIDLSKIDYTVTGTVNYK